MQGLFTHIADKLRNFGILDAVDILLMFTLLYTLFIFLKKNNATIIFKCISIFVVLATVVIGFGLETTTVVVRAIFSVFLVFLIVLFALDIKREVWRLSAVSNKAPHANEKRSAASDEEKKRAISEIVKACLNMAKNDIGAIIVIAQDSIPKHIIESGVVLNSMISSQLIESIFNTNAPLHDGAVFIMANRIVAAGCFLPLSQELSIPKELGTRHRAGIGISESQQVLSIVVSEETGIISLAENGALKRYVDGKTLTDTLYSAYNLSWRG